MTLLTTSEVGERLGISPQRVRKLISDKRLTAAKYGRDYLIDERHLAAVADRKNGRPRKPAEKR